MTARLSPPSAQPRTNPGIATRLQRVAVLVAVGFLALAFMRARERQLVEQERVGERAKDNAATAARAIDAAVTQAQILLHSVSDVIDLAGPPERNDAALAAMLARIPPVFSNINVVDTMGRNLGSAKRPEGRRERLNVADRQYFQEARRSKQFTVGTPVRGRSTEESEWVLPFMLPIRDPATGTVVAFAGASVLVNSLDAVRSARELPEGTVLTATDSAGIVMIRTRDPDRWIGRRFPNWQAEKPHGLDVGSDTAIASELDRIDRLFGTDRTTRVPWTVFVGIPTDVALGPSRAQFGQDLLLGLMISVGIVAIGYWLTGRFVAPIVSLTADVQAIRGGEMSRRSRIASSDEVGELAQSFNLMADAIVERTEQLAESQAQLRQAQKLEALGAFAGGIAHDFNNYLTSIVGHTQLAAEECGPDSQVRTELDGVLEAAQRASALAKQILVFSRRQVVSPTDVSVNATISGMQRLLSRLLGERIELTLALGADLGSVHIDQGQFEQVLVNLIANARDAMPDGGVCVIRTYRTETDGRRMVCMAVEDNGSGIPDALRDQIFDPFFTTKVRAHGTGLGLSISYGIIVAAGGTIHAGSASIGGASFVVSLPEGAVVAPAERPVAEAPPTGQAERILLVDDDDNVRQVGARLLSRAGYTVEQARSGEQALSLLSSASFDLVISDVVMPVMTGPQMVQAALRTHGPMRVLFVSGYPDDDLILEELSNQKAAFLAKPFARETLLQKVHDLLAAPLAVE